MQTRWFFTSIISHRTRFLTSLIIRHELTHHHARQPYLLETTRFQYEQSLRAARDYINKLVAEEKTLLAKINDEETSGETKSDLFTRYDFLKRVSQMNKELADLESDLAELETLIGTDEMGELAAKDAEELRRVVMQKKVNMIDLLLPDDESDQASAMLELSAGVGGLESRIFCSELFEMYKAYAASRGWQFSLRKVCTDNTEIGEMMRQAHVEVEGRGVFDMLKFESGVHRVQRVPKTEAKGRIHTSTVGVVVIPKPDEIRVELHPNDLKIETKTSGGPGGQHANKTESAVRIVHLPTGLI